MCNCKQNEFELIPEIREILGNYEVSNEQEFESRGSTRPAAPVFVKNFSGPSSECTAALRKAGKTSQQALAIINAQIATAIRMLRVAAAKLERGKRTAATNKIFQQIFGVLPSSVPDWLTPTSRVCDRGDVVRARCKNIANLLASGRIRYFCPITAANCPDCGDDSSPFACSSYGSESSQPKNSNVICLGNPFWDDVRNGDLLSILSTLMHEPFHIYYGRYVTQHAHPNGKSVGKFGGIYCVLQFVFRINGRNPAPRVTERCKETIARTKANGY